MKRSRISLIWFLLTCSFHALAQNAEVVKNYINTYKDLAIAEMQRTGVPAAIKLAQGIHETQAGTSNLVVRSNNHFGIKCKSNWTGESVRHDDDARGECFRKYSTAEDSYKDHSNFLKNSQRYTSLFSLDATDYQGWAYGLKNAGYATNPRYPVVLIKLIEDYNLQEYTLIALGKMKDNTMAAVEMKKDDEDKADKKKNKDKEKEADKEEEMIQGKYPEGLFKINDTKVVFVKKGISFLALAQQYEVPLARLFEFNELPETEESTANQLIYLQRKRKTGDNEYHIVQVGESLHDIAQQEAIRLESLMEMNWLKEGERPAPGERLFLKKKSPTVPRLMIKENYSLIPEGKTKPTN